MVWFFDKMGKIFQYIVFCYLTKESLCDILYNTTNQQENKQIIEKKSTSKKTNRLLRKNLQTIEKA